jgi:thiol-disulfide isomerase/thioredoxin
MNKMFVLMPAMLISALCMAQPKGFNVTVKFSGDLTQIKGDSAILTNRSTKAEDLVKVSAVIKNGTATFKGYTDTPEYVGIFFNDPSQKRPFVQLFLENSKINIYVKLGVEDKEKRSKHTATIEGAKTQKSLDSLSAIQLNLYRTANLDSLEKAYSNASEAEKARIEEVYEKYSKEVEKVNNAYMAAHPFSYITLNSIIQDIEKNPVADSQKKLNEFKAKPEFAKNRKIASAEEALAIINSLQIGKTAPDFTQNDPEGNPVTFSNIYKKYKVTMVDFWASWCGPCRRFNPTLVKIYNKFKEKGFGIISVSLDQKKESWIKGIKDDNLTWHHVSDLGYWNNNVAKQYYVRFVPQNIFVDQEGKIIKRQVSEEEIEQLLEEHLK